MNKITEDVKIAVIGNVDSGKCFAENTQIMMYDGSTKAVQAIQVGDILMGDNSSPRNVLETTSGFGMLYTIVPEYGDEYVVNANHVLVLAKYNANNLNYDTVELTVREYLLSNEKANYRGIRNAVHFPAQLVEEDPYTLGVMLAESDSGLYDMRYFSHDVELYIPDHYKFNTLQLRRDFLSGFVDACKGQYWKITGDKLCTDLVWLIHSIGFAVEYIDDNNLKIRGDFSHLNVKVRVQSEPMTWLTPRITIFEHYPGKYYGFEVDGNQRFMLPDFTVTHNSSLIGTLLRGKNDDGRGSNREMVMNYKHEQETGQTSSVGYQILGFREDGTVINVESRSKKDTWPKIMQQTSKLVTFMDLAGHEKYLKTTIHGMSSNHPDYALILVEGRGVRGMTREHLMLTMSFGIPFIIVVTKADLYPPEIVKATINSIDKIIQKTRWSLWMVRDNIDLEVPLKQPGQSIVPLFTVSNVTGQGLDLFKEFLYRLPKRIDYTPFAENPCELSIIEGFSVKGIGSVAHCFVTKGTIRVGDQVWVGPDSTGDYKLSKVRTMQYKRLPVDFVLPGHHCTLSLPGVERKQMKHGVYVLSGEVQRRSVRKFTAEVKVLSTNPITIKKGYCPILNIDNIRMAAKVIRIVKLDANGNEEKSSDVNYIRGGSRAKIQFKFIYRPAYIRPEATFVFREGKTRGFGTVKTIDMEQIPGGIKPKK